MDDAHSPEEALEAEFIHEVNQRVLLPLGLALAVRAQDGEPPAYVVHTVRAPLLDPEFDTVRIAPHNPLLDPEFDTVRSALLDPGHSDLVRDRVNVLLTELEAIHASAPRVISDLLAPLLDPEFDT